MKSNSKVVTSLAGMEGLKMIIFEILDRVFGNNEFMQL